MSTPNGRLARLEKETGTKDVVAADEWWTAMTLDNKERFVVGAIAREGHRNTFLNRVRCPHHLATILRQADWVTRRSLMQTLRALGDVLAQRGEPSIEALFSYLASLNDRPDYRPLTGFDEAFRAAHLAHAPADWHAAQQDALDTPLGPVMAACPLCEPESAPHDLALAALTRAQWSALLVLGYTLCFDGDAPDLTGQLAWITQPASIPARYRALVARARAEAEDLDRRLFGDADTTLQASA